METVYSVITDSSQGWDTALTTLMERRVPTVKHSHQHYISTPDCLYRYDNLSAMTYTVKRRHLIKLDHKQHTFVTVVLVVVAETGKCAECDAGTVTVSLGISDNCTRHMNSFTNGMQTDHHSLKSCSPAYTSASLSFSVSLIQISQPIN